MAWTDGTFLLPSSVPQETLSKSCCPPFCACFLTRRHNWSCSCLLVGLFSFLFHYTPKCSCKKIHQNLKSLQILRPSGVFIQSQTPCEAHTPWLICFFPDRSFYSPPTTDQLTFFQHTRLGLACNVLPIFSCPIPSQHLASASTSLQKDLPQHKCYLLTLL